MARRDVPTIPDYKLDYYREQLLMELSHMFVWEGLPKTIPLDYLERNLVRHGYVMFYEHEEHGLDILRAEPTGYNRHDQPTHARATIHSTAENGTTIERTIKRLTDSEDVVSTFDSAKDAVLINNMYYGQNCQSIVDYFALRLALVQQAFDTNLIWQNIPYIFQTDSTEKKLSLEKMFSDILTGKPFIIADKHLFHANTDRTGVPTGINYIGKELMDTRNEIMMKFRERVGFNTAGVDKAERTNTLEITSNSQHTKTVLEIMLEQRQIAVESINAFYGLNASVGVVESDHDEWEEDANGTSDSGTEELTQD